MEYIYRLFTTCLDRYSLKVDNTRVIKISIDSLWPWTHIDIDPKKARTKKHILSKIDLQLKVPCDIPMINSSVV